MLNFFIRKVGSDNVTNLEKSFREKPVLFAIGGAELLVILKTQDTHIFKRKKL
jgi:hypothetical protein